ncbi:hypothetical protein SDRG_14860 [Saprolegnia diclina VS20]|uniref:EF-hand domain-containing protein n=1 Tax=Saprolegnia diclina (strain VS20) TaxID=1156394 RepID=T0PYM4_SAPDV|nr:hypothetical protein SDRG_14860 [Saprolegnia diclina VS20]EQC27336.1 hypothetical protein SDRG_14860 [Saprolegnia diclina VS20]|eukprot:XP_008619240.1 hypothetical protein SDRG_14860 [Saprolegnia diclina VS20]
MERAREIFDRFDTSRDGAIDRSEMGGLLQALGVEPTNQNIVSAIVDMDVGQRGSVSFADFAAYYKTNFLPRQPLKTVASKHVAGIGEAKQASYTLPPKSFCFGKALQRDKENAGQVLRQHGDAGDEYGGRRTTHVLRRTTTAASSKVNEARSLSSLSGPTTKPKADEIDHGMAFILSQIKTQLKAMGASGLQGLSRRFRLMTSSGGGIPCSAFKSALKDLKLDVSERDARRLFELFDVDRSDSIDLDEFLAALSEPMNAARIAVVRAAFDALDYDGNGVLSASDIKGRYDTSKHPDVRSGLKTDVEVLTEFLSTFFDPSRAKTSSVVTYDDFAQYYQHLSNVIDNDEAFANMITNAWRVRAPVAAAWSSVRPRTAKSTISNSVQPVQLAKGHFPRMTSAWMSTDSASSLLYNGSSSAPATDPRDEDGAIDLASLDAGKRGVIARVKAQMQAIGVPAYACVLRRAKRTPTLSLAEFKNTMKDAGVILSDKDWRVLFELYDPNDTGRMSFASLVQQLLVERLPDARCAIVRRTFRALDADKNGSLPYGDFIARFDPSSHPDVRSGKCSEAQIHTGLHDAFVLPPSGLVTQAEFEAYYEMVSNTLDDDSVFEATVRDVWHTRFDVLPNDDDKDVRDMASLRSATTSIKTNKDPLRVYEASVKTQKIMQTAKSIASADATRMRRASRPTKSSMATKSKAASSASQRKSWT